MIDLDFILEKNPLTDDIDFLNESQSIKNGIKNLLYLELFDTPYKTDLNIDIRSKLFKRDIFSLSVLESSITNALNKYETLIKLESVNVSVANHYINISISYIVKSTKKVQSVTLDVYFS